MGTPPAKRIRGVDAARALAVVGMVMVHIGPTGGPGAAGTVYGITHGRASVLFVLLAGVGVSILAGGRVLSGGSGTPACDCCSACSCCSRWASRCTSSTPV